MKLNAWIVGVLAACLGGGALAQQPLTEVTFGTNWIAQGEHGGYYQALADGTYEKYGLKVTIVRPTNVYGAGSRGAEDQA